MHLSGSLNAVLIYLFLYERIIIYELTIHSTMSVQKCHLIHFPTLKETASHCVSLYIPATSNCHHQLDPLHQIIRRLNAKFSVVILVNLTIVSLWTRQVKKTESMKNYNGPAPGLDDDGGWNLQVFQISGIAYDFRVNAPSTQFLWNRYLVHNHVLIKTVQSRVFLLI